MGRAVIKTDRLLLRPFVQDDAPAIVDGIGDLAVARWLRTVPIPYRLEDAETFLASVEGDEGQIWAIEGEAGLCGVIGTDEELGYWLRQDHWGRGLVTEAARAVLADWFSNPDAPPITSGYFDGNARSAGVLGKLGFGKRGTQTLHCQALDQDVLSHRMILTPEQYHAMHPWIIHTKRLTLRPLGQHDLETLVAMAGVDPVARNLLSVPVPWPLDEAARWVELSRWRGRLGFRLGIERDGVLIGSVGLGRRERGGGATTMYFLSQDHWGQGYATEAMAAFLPAAAERFALTEILADHFADNPASGRVLQKLGFERIGEKSGGSAARVEDAPLILYRLSLTQ
ncbi:MAG: GNAT family N-acetyltransferase [Pseudomonadota bacterium]